MGRRWIGIGALLAMLGVAAGAFGAHALRDRLTPADLEIFRTGASYHQLHAVALALIGVVLGGHDSRLLRASAWLMLVGIVIFSGTLYGLVLTGMRWLGAITPIGGVCLMAAWLCLALGAWKRVPE